jgi:hypothetical protein
MSDLDIFARELLDFAIERVEEGLKGGATDIEYFREADYAIEILIIRLCTEKHDRHLELLMRHSQGGFVSIVKQEYTDDIDVSERLKRALSGIAEMREKFV